MDWEISRAGTFRFVNTIVMMSMTSKDVDIFS